MCDFDQEQVSQQILAYLLRNREAQDTAEGIVEWWVLEQSVACRLASARHALENLVAQRFLLTRQTGNGQVAYRLNRRRLRQIQALLAQG